MPIDLGERRGCVKCCCRHCYCGERDPAPPHDWRPCRCDFCTTHPAEIQQHPDRQSAQATYVTNP